MDTYIDKCGLTKWIGAYSHFAYLLPLSAILPTHAKCDQTVETTICASFWGDWSARYNFILFGSHFSLALSAFGTSPKNATISSSVKMLVWMVGCNLLYRDVSDMVEGRWEAASFLGHSDWVVGGLWTKVPGTTGQSSTVGWARERVYFVLVAF